MKHNHRVIETDRDLFRSCGSVTLLEKDCLHPVTQDHVLMVFENIEEWRVHKFPEQLCNTTVGHNNTVVWCSALFQLVLIVSGPGTGHHWKKSGSVLFAPFLQIYIFTDIIPLNLLFYRWDSWGPSGCQCNPLAYQPKFCFLVLCHQQTSWGYILPHHPEHYWRCYRSVLILGMHCWLLAFNWASFCWSPPWPGCSDSFQSTSLYTYPACALTACVGGCCGPLCPRF